jgi:hypothetical protein
MPAPVCRGSQKMVPNRTFAEVPTPFGLIVRGGAAALTAGRDDALHRYVQSAGETAELVASIGTGSLILGRSGCWRGARRRRPGLRTPARRAWRPLYLPALGGEWEVHHGRGRDRRDRHGALPRRPPDRPGDHAQGALDIEYDPRSPFGGIDYGRMAVLPRALRAAVSLLTPLLTIGGWTSWVCCGCPATRSWGAGSCRLTRFPAKTSTSAGSARTVSPVVGRLVGAAGRRVSFAGGEMAEVEVVIWATGYRDQSEWVAIPEVKDADGAFVQRRGISPLPNVTFVGRSWQWTRGSALLTGVGADAAYIAQHLVRMLDSAEGAEGGVGMPATATAAATFSDGMPVLAGRGARAVALAICHHPSDRPAVSSPI